jgi:hypothetical protein
MNWFKWPSWGQKTVAQAEDDVVKAQQALTDARANEGVPAESDLGGPTPPPAMGGRRRHKKTRRAKKGKSRKARK